MPATCIVINPNRANDEEIYLATDVGVFYRNKYMSQWECYNGLLPNVRVSDLKVNRHRKTLYAATYGRGIWRTSLFCPTVLSYTLPTSPLNFYAASSFISSSSIIDGGRDVAYRAPSIYLTSGFKVVLGTRFTANSYSCAAYVPNRIVQNNSNNDELPQIKQKQEKGENLLEFSVSPTPTSSNIKIDYNLEEKGNTYIYLTDIRGKLVKNLYRESQQEAGKYNLSFNLSDVQNGIYFVVMQNDETTTYKKVIIQK